MLCLTTTRQYTMVWPREKAHAKGLQILSISVRFGASTLEIRTAGHWCHREQKYLVGFPTLSNTTNSPRNSSVAASFFSRLLLLRGSNPYMVQFMVHSLNVLLSTGVPRPDPSTNLPTQCTRSLQSTTAEGQCAVVKWHALFEVAWEHLHYPVFNFRAITQDPG